MVFFDKKNNSYNTKDIVNYQLMDSKKSGTSTVLRAGLGAVALGPVGLLVGVTAKKKFSVLVIFKNNEKKVVDLDEKNLKILMENV